VDPRVGLNDMEKRKFFTLPGLELRPLGVQSVSQALYRLSVVRIEGTLCRVTFCVRRGEGSVGLQFASWQNRRREIVRVLFVGSTWG
jgi:hypothetical protein